MQFLSLSLLQQQLHDEKFRHQYLEKMCQDTFKKSGETDNLIYWVSLQQESARKIRFLEKEIQSFYFGWEDLWY